MKTINKQVLVEPKVANPLIHIVDVNMAITKSKDIKKKMFWGQRTKSLKIYVGEIKARQTQYGYQSDMRA